MRKAAKRVENLAHDHDSETSSSSSDEDYGDMGHAAREGRMGTQAGLGFEEESIETAQLRAQVGQNSTKYPHMITRAVDVIYLAIWDTN